MQYKIHTLEMNIAFETIIHLIPPSGELDIIAIIVPGLLHLVEFVIPQ